MDTPGIRARTSAAFTSGNLPIESAATTSTTFFEVRWRLRERAKPEAGPTMTMVLDGFAETDAPVDGFS
jgi:hypothetical protein